MRKIYVRGLATFVLAFAALSVCYGESFSSEAARLDELDAYWAEVSRCVEEGDFAGYVATCHPEGVLVAGTRGQSQPLSDALKRWEKDFIDTKSGAIKASVAFRFSQRLGDATTAHETGIFLYQRENADGSKTKEYIHLEALLLKRGTWKIVMEYQKSAATKEDWDRLESQSARLLSAFFGLDNGLPRVANTLCRGAAGKDGMPVVLSHTVDEGTLQAEDFRVYTRSGEERTPFCVTLRPATDEGELRTVLLIGDFGDADNDPPVKALVVGDLYSDGKSGDKVNFSGAETDVIQLEAGPTLVLAEVVPEEEWSQRGRGSACPVGTKQVVRATWAGGVRLPSGADAADAVRALYRVTVQRPDGSREEIAPQTLAELGDRDNNHFLCLDTTDPAVLVSFPAGYLVDPNQDLNPATQIVVTGGLRGE